MPTSVMTALGFMLLLFGVIAFFEGLPLVGAVLIALSAVSFVVWWRMWANKT